MPGSLAGLQRPPGVFHNKSPSMKGERREKSRGYLSTPYKIDSKTSVFYVYQMSPHDKKLITATRHAPKAGPALSTLGFWKPFFSSAGSASDLFSR